MQELKNWLAEGFQYYQAGNFQAAEVLFQKVLMADPGNVQALYLLGTLHAQQQSFPKAIQLLRKATELQPGLTDAHANLGNAFYEHGEYDEAISCYQQAISLNPSSLNAQIGLGKALQITRQYKQAIACFEYCLVLQPEYFDALCNLGAIFKTQQQLARAEEFFRRALVANPRSAEVHAYLGRILTTLGRYEDAESSYRQATALEPGNAGAHSSWGDLLRVQGNVDEAAKHYQQAVDIDPSFTDAQIRLGFALLVTGSEEKRQLLQRLEEDKVLTDVMEVKQLATDLSRFYGYFDPDMQQVLEQVFSELEPGKMYPASWWRAVLGRFGQRALAHDKIMRGVLSAIYSWSIPSQEALESIAGFIGNARLASYGSGAGYWEHLLHTHFNIDVIASDRKLRHRFVEMQRSDYAEAGVQDSDVIFLSWVPEGTSNAEGVLKQMQGGQRLVLIGEPPDKQGFAHTCGTDSFFGILSNDFRHEKTEPLVQFSWFNDCVSFYIKE